VTGSVLGLELVAQQHLDSSVVLVCRCTVSCGSISRTIVYEGTLGDQEPSMLDDLCDVGPMSIGGGWDEAAWSAAGLPTSGELELRLHVHSVGAAGV
jgi:hypothetical protein